MTVLTDDREPLHLLTVEEYFRMAETGILTREDKVELLDGALIAMSPEGEPHAVLLSLVNRWLVRGVQDDRRIVRIGSPLTLPPLSVPQPDLALVDLADSIGSHPGTAHLVVEVSHSSLRKDRVRKARIYAAAGLPQYWIVDVAHRAIIVHLDPTADGYGKIETHKPPDLLDPEVAGIPPLDLEALFKHL